MLDLPALFLDVALSHVLPLAQAVDPVKAGEKLGNAQSAQQVLGFVVAALVVAVLGLCTFYLRERKAWGLEKAELIKAAGEEKADLIKRWGEAKTDWEKERRTHAGRLAEVAEQAAAGREQLMREMLDLALRIDKSLGILAELKRERT